MALFRPCRDLSRAGPFHLANNLLVPWSNRIFGGGFQLVVTTSSARTELAGRANPFYGNGFSSPWSVESAAAERVELLLTSNGPGPFCYEARAAYTLDAGALKMWLGVRNVGSEALPFGLGFHPWVVRTPRPARMQPDHAAWTAAGVAPNRAGFASTTAATTTDKGTQT